MFLYAAVKKDADPASSDVSMVEYCQDLLELEKKGGPPPAEGFQLAMESRNMVGVESYLPTGRRMLHALNPIEPPTA